MRTTLTIDDQLFAKAVLLVEPGIAKSELLRECVKAFIQRQTARRLAASLNHARRQCKHLDA